MILCVDGNIACGKSTFCQNLYEFLTARGYNVKLFTEPLDKWRNVGGLNMLELFYKDIRRWAFTFQINAALSVADIEKSALLHSLNGTIVIIERSSFSVFEIFCKYLSKNVFNAAESSIVEDFKTKYSSIINNYNRILYIYISTNYRVCNERLNDRQRPEEINLIDQSYLKDLQDLYEEAVTKLGVSLITVNGEYDKNSIEGAKNMIGDKIAVDEILKYIKSYGY